MILYVVVDVVVDVVDVVVVVVDVVVEVVVEVVVVVVVVVEVVVDVVVEVVFVVAVVVRAVLVSRCGQLQASCLAAILIQEASGEQITGDAVQFHFDVLHPCEVDRRALDDEKIRRHEDEVVVEYSHLYLHSEEAVVLPILVRPFAD